MELRYAIASLDENLIVEFKNSIREDVIFPKDAAYSEVRIIYKAMIDKRPGKIGGVDPGPANVGKITRWTRDFREATLPCSTGGPDSNFMMEEGQDRLEASFKHHLARLVEIKPKYDPNNFFSINQSINPTVVDQPMNKIFIY